MITKKKIAYVSGTRADFGLMTPVLRAIRKSKKLELAVYATGEHLMPSLGETINEVKKEFPDVKSIAAVFESDSRTGAAKFSGEFLKALVADFIKDQPDVVLVLGDRVEMLCAAISGVYLGIPVSHIHGGEKTSTVDEVARHAITKLAHIHFPATKNAAKRIKKMGEEAWRIHVVGAPALDVILNEKLPTRAELCGELGIDPKNKIILITQHPVSEAWQESGREMEETMAAVKKFNLPAVVIYPHADSGGRKIIEVIERERDNQMFHIFPSLSYKKFLALERECAVWVGNSSGAMIESASFGTPVVNVGLRQAGRERGQNVIDAKYDRREIASAIHKSLNDARYLKKLSTIKNPWGDGQAAKRIVKVLENIIIDRRLLSKQIAY